MQCGVLNQLTIVVIIIIIVAVSMWQWPAIMPFCFSCFFSEQLIQLCHEMLLLYEILVG